MKEQETKEQEVHEFSRRDFCKLAILFGEGLLLAILAKYEADSLEELRKEKPKAYDAYMNLRKR